VAVPRVFTSNRKELEMVRRVMEDLRQQERIINKFLADYGSDQRVRIEGAYGKQRLYIGPGGDSRRELSPRLSMGELYTWLDAFRAGLDTCFKLMADKSEAMEAIDEITSSIGYDLDMHTEGWKARQKYYVRLFFDGGVVAEEHGSDLTKVLKKMRIIARQLSKRGC
jgi:hypothetical protein